MYPPTSPLSLSLKISLAAFISLSHLLETEFHSLADTISSTTTTTTTTTLLLSPLRVLNKKTMVVLEDYNVSSY
jgi:hypothetical protein